MRQHLRRQHDATHLGAAGDVLFLGALRAAASTAATAAAAAEVDVSGVDVGCAVAADLTELSQECRGAISGLKNVNFKMTSGVRVQTGAKRLTNSILNNPLRTGFWTCENSGIAIPLLKEIVDN